MDHLKELIELAKKDFDECKTLTELDNSKSKYIDDFFIACRLMTSPCQREIKDAPAQIR